jgi:hypothetical protein
MFENRRKCEENITSTVDNREIQSGGVDHGLAAMLAGWP